MSIKPILFNTEMVRTILDGRKTVTRRVVKPRYQDGDAGINIVTNAHTGEFCYIEYYDEDEMDTGRRIHPPCVPGDILYVRETWVESADGYAYKADHSDSDGLRWRPSIYMPHEAARIWLRVTDVRVERLQEINAEDVFREGIIPNKVDYCTACGYSEQHYPACDYEHCGNYEGLRYFQPFIDVWDSTIKPADLTLYGWGANPWVWRIEFERCAKPETGGAGRG